MASVLADFLLLKRTRDHKKQPPLIIFNSVTYYTPQWQSVTTLSLFHTSFSRLSPFCFSIVLSFSSFLRYPFAAPIMEPFTHMHCSFPTLLLACLFFSPIMVASLGINYGQIANNLPSPENVIPLVKSIGASRVKLYDADPKVLKAFANTNIEFIVSLGNEYLSTMRDASKAQAWVKKNVQAYLPSTKITCIAVGNEVLTFNDTSLTSNLLPAMQSVHTALVNLKLDKQVTVTTAHSLAVLETSYPPSAGAFRKDLVECVTQIVDFHCKTGSPFLINAYPYFAYKGNPKQVSLDFVLFQPNSGIVDPESNLHYDNMLFAQIDAVHSALASIGYKNVCVQISETGWPSKGDADEAGATPENARKYNCNLMKLIGQKKGTPMRPNSDLNIYVFALFNENLKPGPSSERNYGLFNPDRSQAYPLGVPAVDAVNKNSSSSGGGSGSGTGATPSASLPPASSSSGYLAITSDSGTSLSSCKSLSLYLLGFIPLALQF